MEYDVIVIGAGNAGLVAALTLKKKGKNVLILEQGKTPGGASSSFKRGRFEFDVTPQIIGDYGTYENPGCIYKLFQRLGISSKISMKNLEESFHLIIRETKESYTMPSKIENFIETMENIVKDSKDSMITFFGLCEEIRDALQYIEENKEISFTKLYETYPNFIQIAPHKVKTILEKINMPKKAIEIFSSFWIYFGTPIDELSFIYFALVVESLIKYVPCMPGKTSYEISKTLEEEFKALGGVVKYNEIIEEILVKEGEVIGLKTESEIIKTKKIISNISPITVYGKLIPKENTNISALKLQNKRELGAKQITVYLGLNKTKKELNLNHTQYFILNSLNTDKEEKRINNVLNKNLIAYVLDNNGIEGTSKIILSSIFFGEEFNKMLTQMNYYDLKNKLAKSMIEIFEESTEIKITEWIEEIEVATPVTYARFTNHPEGTTYGFSSKGYDNFLPRIFSEEEENFIKGLYFCGAFGRRLSENKEVLLNGEEIALKISEECEK